MYRAGLALILTVALFSASCTTGSEAATRPEPETDEARAAQAVSEDAMEEKVLESYIGVWEGVLEVPGARLDVTVRFLAPPPARDAVPAAGAGSADGPTQPAATMDIPAQQAYRLPLRNVTASGLTAGAAVHFELQTGGPALVFDGELRLPVGAPDEGGVPVIAGTFVQGQARGTMSVSRTGELTQEDLPQGGQAAIPDAGEETRVSVSSGEITIHGTVLRPDDEDRPLLIIVAGSGPTDRDGNSAMLPGPNDSLKQLAQALARNGIASLRYDKRGIGASRPEGFSEADLTFTDQVDDLAAWIEWARKQPGVSSIHLAGHSEGGLVVLTATGTGRVSVDGVITIAAPGRSFDKLTLEQLRESLGETSALYAAARNAFAALKNGEPVPDVPPELAALFRPSVYPYLRSVIPLEPQELAAATRAPILVVTGDQDLQVPVGDALLLKAAAVEAELVVVEGMNHVLKTVPAGDLPSNQRSYYDPSFPLAGGLVDAVVRFVQSVPVPE